MLDKLRDSAKSWVAKVLLGLLAASFVVWGVADVFTFRPGSALATVGDREISGQLSPCSGWTKKRAAMKITGASRRVVVVVVRKCGR